MKWLNKKGSGEESGLEAFIKISVTVLFLLLFFYIGYKILGALFGWGGDRDSLSNFKSLAENVEFMVEKDSDFDSQTMIFYLKKGYFVFGFNGRKSDIPSGWYPKDCEDKPCLCLYKKFDTFSSNPYKCKVFDKSVIFHGYNAKGIETLTSNPLDPRRVAITEPQQAELYADYPEELAMDFKEVMLTCDSRFFSLDLYLEKFVTDDNNIHIFIASELYPETIEQRISLLAECPFDSDDDCKEKRRNSFINEANTEFCYFDEEDQKCLLKTNIKNCDFNQKITEDCICGSKFVIAKSYPDDMYCFNREDGKIFLLPFDCESDEFKEKEEKCFIYCGVLIDNDECSTSKEKYYCDTDPCGFGTLGRECEIATVGKKTICRHHYVDLGLAFIH